MLGGGDDTDKIKNIRKSLVLINVYFALRKNTDFKQMSLGYKMKIPIKLMRIKVTTKTMFSLLCSFF